MIVNHYDRNSSQQFIRGNPIRFGYNLWALCGPSGYCYNVDLHCGKQVLENKMGKGSFDFRFEEAEEILILKWNDNSSVMVGTNFDSVEPLSNVSRWLPGERRKGAVKRPQVVNNYSKYMGGVDLHDWLIGKFS
ncbi:PiggyBac transposable element-derived protein, partial [Trinorchestia longiramus]